MNIDLFSVHFDVLDKLFNWNLVLRPIRNSLHFDKSSSILNELHKNPLPVQFEFWKNDISICSNYFNSFSQFFQFPAELNEYSIIALSNEVQSSDLIKIENLSFFHSLITQFDTLSSSFAKLSIFDNSFSHFIENYMNSYSHLFIGEKINYKSFPRLNELQLQFDQVLIEIRKSLADFLTFLKGKTGIDDFTTDYLYSNFYVSIPTDIYQHQFGRISHHSSSGKTVYIIPKSIESLNTQLSEIKSEIDLEILKIEIELSNFIKGYLKHVISFLDFVCFFDLQMSISNFLESNNSYSMAHLSISEYKADDLGHPLIHNCCTNSISLTNKNGLLLSGPNAGGKTILLKSICLQYLMTKCGLPIFSSNCVISLPKKLFWVYSDFDTTLNALSSFSTEATLYANILANNEPSFVLFSDEIFNNTSSETAGPLAFKLLEYLANFYNSTMFISTHHESLKILNFEANLLENCHMGFNLKDLKPTFNFVSGRPGDSFAVSIFSNILKEIFPDALNICDISQLQISQCRIGEIIERLNVEISSYKEEKDRISIIEEELVKKEKSMDGLLLLKEDELFKKYKSLENSLLTKFKSIVDDTNKQRVSNKVYLQSIAKLKETSSPTELKISQGQITISDLKIGMSIRSLVFNQNLKILDINPSKNVVLIKFGNMKTWHSPDQLQMHDGTLIVSTTPSHSSSYERNTEYTLNFDGRGLRLDDFMSKVEPLVFDVLNGEIPYLDIVHGHGNGILKNCLREYLKTFLELRWENIDGNDGVTRITLIE